MKKLNLKNLKQQKITSEKMKKIIGGGFCYPSYWCGAYYCAVINPSACCCP